MARPRKNRRICGLPFCSSFSPDSSTLQSEFSVEEPVILNLDEFETIRLIDYEERDQKTCAEQMNVARTTVQAIYESARAKIAECLVEGRSLKIEGGDYAVCGTGEGSSGCPIGKRCCLRNFPSFIDERCTLAVTYEEGSVFQHFGQTKSFKIYYIEDNKIIRSEILQCAGRGRGTLAGYLRNKGVSVLICGRMGPGARNALGSTGIMVYSGVTGDADTCVKDFLSGNLRCGNVCTESGRCIR